MFKVRLFLKGGKPGTGELLRSALVNSGIPAEKIVEEKGKDGRSFSIFTGSDNTAYQIKERLKALKIKGARISVGFLKEEEWKDRWKRYFHPFNISMGIRIIPAWVKNQRLTKNRKTVIIDTAFAFGTGTHPTTQMMARLIESKRGTFFSFLDIGTGSGILSLVASACGAGKICAIDTDKEAVRTAESNFLLNHCEPAHCRLCDLKDFSAREHFDFIAANLLTEDLVKFKPKLIRLLKSAGYLAVSGIHKDNYKSFRKRWSSPFLSTKAVLYKKGWYALLFKRSVRRIA